MAARRLWNPHEVRRVLAFYTHVPTAELARAVRHPIHSVYTKAHGLGLKRNRAYLKELGRKLAAAPASIANRFRPGLTPFNKGIKGWQAGGRSAETRFKPGQRGSKWVPIGSERIADGFLQRKLTDMGYSPRDWRPVHVLLWEEHNGPVPHGHAVIFRDGNRRNIVIENLELITRGELMRRNSIHHYPPALKDAIRTAGRLRRTIEKAAQ